MQKIKYTPEINDFIRLNYAHSHTSAQAIADHLNAVYGWDLKYWSISRQAAILGIGHHKMHNWDDEQDAILRKWGHKYSPEHVGKLMTQKFGTPISENAIINRLRRLNISRREHDGWYTKKDVCEIMGVDHHTIQPYIDAGKLSAHYHTGKTPRKTGMAMWHVEGPDFAKFIIQFAEDFRGRNVDLLRLIGVLLPGIYQKQSEPTNLNGIKPVPAFKPDPVSVTVKPPSIPKIRQVLPKPAPAEVKPRAAVNFSVGDPVIHANFGKGEVTETGTETVTVYFSSCGAKKFLVAVAPLARL
jgi:hypothetical protein